MNPGETDAPLLTTAVDRGYFKIPQQISLVDIAEAHGISDVEASHRLRTEIDTLFSECLGGVEDTVPPERE